MSEYSTVINNEEHNTNTQDANVHNEHKDAANENIFMKLLGKLSDHDALYIGAYKITDLPKIYIDNGFHFYWNYKEVEQS